MLRKLGASLAVIATAVVGFAGAAFAQEEPLNVTAEVTSLAQEGLSTVAPVILAVAGVAIGLAALMFGVRYVMRAVRSGGRAVG